MSPSSKSESPFNAPLGPRLALGFTKIGLALRHKAWQEAHAKDLTPTQGQALVILQRSPGATLAEVAGELGVRPSTASEAVTVLCQKKLVAKSRSASDGRVVQLKLTRKGQERATQAGSWPDFLARATEEVPEDEAGVLLRALQRIIRSLQEQGEIPVARMCSTCVFFRPFQHEESSQPHHCAFVDAPLGERDLRFDCSDHQKAEDSAAATRYFQAPTLPLTQ